MQKKLFLLMLGTVILTDLLFVSCRNKLTEYRLFPDYQTGYSAVTSSSEFNWENLVLSKTEGLNVDDRLWLSAVGDVTGDSDAEVIISHNRGVDILNQDGDILSTLKDPGYFVESILFHDIDKDGKDEILLGKQGSSTAGFTVIDGKCNELKDVTLLESPRARTKLHFVYGNSVYLSSAPLFNIAPKIAAAVDLESGEPEFIYHSAPLVTSLYRGKSGHLALGNHGMGREGRTVAVPYKGEYNKPAVLVVERKGSSGSEEVLHESLGSEVKEGYPDSNPVTEVTTKLVDIDGDGKEEVISLLEAESAFTRGTIRLEIRDSGGNLKSVWVGPEEEKGDFIFYYYKNKFRIMLVLSRTAKVLILDGDLKPVLESKLFSDNYYHELSLRHYGDINGDGKMDFMLSDANTLVVLDQNLDIQFTHLFNGFIKAVHLFPDGNKTRVLVQAGDLYPLIIDKNLVLEDHNYQKKLFKSQYTLSNLKLKKESGTYSIFWSRRHKTEPLSFNRNPLDFKPILENILFPEEYAIRNAETDIQGDEADEILVTLVNKRKAAVMDKDYQLLYYLADPLQINYPGRKTASLFTVIPDLTGDGKAELAPNHFGDMYTTVMDGRGTVLQNHLFSHGYDSDSVIIMARNGILHQRLTTGYLLHPRGMLYYDTETQKYDAYNPGAIMMGYTFNEYFDGHFYYGTFTSSNGSEYTHSDGTVEMDSEYYFHVAKEGDFSTKLSQKYPENEENQGKLYPFVLDIWNNLKHEAVETLVFATSRIKDYYPGPFEFFSYNFQTAKRTVLFTGPENGEIMSIDTALYNGTKVYALFFKYHGIWIVDNKLSVIKKLDINSNTSLNQLVADFDGDGTSEFMRIESNRLVILDINGDELNEIKVPAGVTPKFITNIEQMEDGAIRITVSMKKGIYVYKM